MEQPGAYGKLDDVNKNSVVLKVNGDLTLDTGYTLTSVKSGTAVGKGLFIYCTGVATINGTVNMSGVTCTAEGQNVYLWKNRDGSFEYIRKNGAPAGGRGGAGYGYGYSYTAISAGQESVKITDTHIVTGGGR